MGNVLWEALWCFNKKSTWYDLGIVIPSACPFWSAKQQRVHCNYCIVSEGAICNYSCVSWWRNDLTEGYCCSCRDKFRILAKLNLGVVSQQENWTGFVCPHVDFFFLPKICVFISLRRGSSTLRCLLMLKAVHSNVGYLQVQNRAENYPSSCKR